MADALWILVANASRARLFATDNPAGPWDLREESFHEESRALARELLNQPDNPNAGSLHRPLPENEPDGRRELEHERFARQLASRLERGVDDHAFERLVVAAPPEFLGRLRRHLPARVHQRLVLDLSADFSRVPVHELPERIPLG